MKIKFSTAARPSAKRLTLALLGISLILADGRCQKFGLRAFDSLFEDLEYAVPTVQYRDERGRIEACGKELETRWLGPRPDEAPTLVFLHEGLGCVDLWRDFPQRLSEELGWGALIYSRAGYGRSDQTLVPRPLTYLEQEGLEVLPEVVRACRLRRYLLIGHSDGGSIALVFAGSGTSASRAGLMAVITEAAHVFTEDKCVSAAQRARDHYINGDLRRRLERYHGENVDCAFWGWNRAWLDPEFSVMNLEGYLPHIQVPCLLIQGEDDEYGTAAQMSAIANGLPSDPSTFMVPACGHTPHHEQGESVFKKMVAFVRSISTASDSVSGVR